MNEIYLKPMCENDLLQVLEWRNSKRVRESMYTNTLISLAQHKKWFEDCQQRVDRKNFIAYFNQIPVGVVNITDIDNDNETCSWSIYRGQESCPKQTGYKIGMSALEYIFNSLKSRKVFIDVLGNNLVSICFHKKLGFKVEGIFKNQIIRENNTIDVVRMAIFKKDFKHE